MKFICTNVSISDRQTTRRGDLKCEDVILAISLVRSGNTTKFSDIEIEGKIRRMLESIEQDES